jgi:hypothetical protein
MARKRTLVSVVHNLLAAQVLRAAVTVHNTKAVVQLHLGALAAAAATTAGALVVILKPILWLEAAAVQVMSPQLFCWAERTLVVNETPASSGTMTYRELSLARPTWPTEPQMRKTA